MFGSAAAFSNGTRIVNLGGELEQVLAPNALDYCNHCFYRETPLILEILLLQEVNLRTGTSASNIGSGFYEGCFLGGSTTSGTNVIDYMTISSTGNATDFGDSLHATAIKYLALALSNGNHGGIASMITGENHA